MYIECVQYSAEPGAVMRLIHPDGTAEYHLVADVVRRKDAEGNEVIEGREVYFEIPATMEQPTEECMKERFDKWWQYGIDWPVQEPPVKSAEERLAQLEQAMALVYRLVDAMRDNPLLAAIVDKIEVEK